MEENLPTNARRVGSCVVTRTGATAFDVTFMNGPVYENRSVYAAIGLMVDLGCDHDEAETAVVHLLMDEAFK